MLTWVGGDLKERIKNTNEAAKMRGKKKKLILYKMCMVTVIFHSADDLVDCV